ncbi:hypothetical protein BG011_001683, partial [Mortierella polycephala]
MDSISLEEFLERIEDPETVVLETPEEMQHFLRDEDEYRSNKGYEAVPEEDFITEEEYDEIQMT